MNTDIIGINSVFVTDNINTSLFSQYWFIKNRVLNENDLQSDSVFTPGLTIVSANEFQFLIMPNQIQFSMKTGNIEVAQRCIADILMPFVANLENVRVKAIGLNFGWRVIDTCCTMHETSKRLFQIQALSDIFNADDTLYGSYFSQNFDENTRLHLDFKPTRGDDNGRSLEFILASFNYHRDIQENGQSEQLKSQIAKWDTLYNHSKSIVCALR